MLEFESDSGGFLFITLLSAGVVICFLRVSSSGIPGIRGVCDGTGVLPIFVVSGMPGIEFAAFDLLFALIDFGSGIPGVEFVEGGI